MPTGKYVLSFPAGSKDQTDPDPGFTALRELKEETGYSGEVVSWSKNHMADPWKGIGRTKTVWIEVDLASEQNLRFEQEMDLEPEEDIISEWLPVDDLLQRLEYMVENSDMELDA